MRDLLSRTLTPALRLANVIGQWPAVRHALAERPRRRVSQRDQAFAFLS
jgi:hypothetical protein